MFELELGALELPLSVPGHWFGAPPLALATMPIVSGAIGAQSNAMATLSAVVVGGSLYLWFSTLNKLRDGGNMGRIYMPGGSSRYALFLLLPHIALLLCRACGGGRAAVPAAAFAQIAWLLTQALIAVLKIGAGRCRPVACEALAGRLAGGRVRRRFPQLQDFLRSPTVACESFPSGDAAGASSWAAAAIVMATHGAAGAPVLGWLGPSCAFGSAFGRVYFHAHHILDVLVGAVLGASVTYGCGELVLGEHALLPGPDHLAVGVAQILFVAIFLGSRPKHEPKQE